jgi:hypothetical protein
VFTCLTDNFAINWSVLAKSFTFCSTSFRSCLYDGPMAGYLTVELAAVWFGEVIHTQVAVHKCLICLHRLAMLCMTKSY